MRFIFGVLLFVGMQPLWAGQVIRLKTRALKPPGIASRTTVARHLILQFESRPDSRLVAELAHRRIRVLAYLPDSGLMVSREGDLDLTGLDFRWAGPLQAADKISPSLAGDSTGVYLVIFHPDVEAAVARGVAESQGLQVLENPGLRAGDLLVDGDRDRVLELAGYDEVAYILPARTELALRKRVYGCPGALTPAGTIADYVLAGSGWPADASGKVALQYFFESVTEKIAPATVKSEIARALAQWTLYANVTFTPAQEEEAARSVDILFATGAHGDSYPFTGTAVLAHTFYPAPPNAEPVAGDMHFNDAEAWQVGAGIDVFSVALHEAGHALGLGHSDDPDAVMYPYYKQAAGLAADDIAAIQALYGSPSKTPVTPPVTTPPVTTPPATPPTPVTPPVTSPTSPGSPAGADTTPPSLSITIPALTIVSTTASSYALSGTASDNVGVVSVQWTASTGGTGTAAGTTNWSANVALLVGTNVITVRAFDAAGNCGWRAITIVRQ